MAKLSARRAGQTPLRATWWRAWPRLACVARWLLMVGAGGGLPSDRNRGCGSAWTIAAEGADVTATMLVMPVV